MKYLYYTLHLFYVKILQLHKQYPPIINITAVMSFLMTSFGYSVVDAYQKNESGFNDPKYYIFIAITLIGFNLVLYKILYDYYKPREAKLLKEMNSKPLWQKVVIVSISVLFVMLVIKLWMFDGMSELYQFLKHILIRG